MNIKKSLLTLCSLLVLTSCSNTPSEIKPTSLKPAKEEVSLILGSKRNLNDIITLIFEPEGVTNKKVSWSTTETEIFTLEGEEITAKKVGSGIVTATSLVDSTLFTNVTINVYDNSAKTYEVSCVENPDFTISGLKESYEAGETVSFTVELLNEEKLIEEVKINETILEAISENNYSFTMPEENVVINVTLKDKEIPLPPQTGSSNYDVIFDLGTRKTPLLFKEGENDVILNTFSAKPENENIITSVKFFEYIYGGGSGGRGDTGWYTGNMLKFGTTSVTASLELELSTFVNKVVITGYTTDAKAQVRVGDAASTDWSETNADNKTSLMETTDMNLAIKENVEGNLTSTISFEFEKTKNLKIATIKAKPIYITGIEFIYA